MSPAFQMTEPSGEIVTVVRTGSVLQAMREGSETYWSPRSPVLQLTGSNPRFELMLIRHPRRGFYVLYSSFEPERRHLVAVQPGNFSEKWVEIWAFDQVGIAPAKCFVPLPIAEKIVEEYLATQEPSSESGWQELDWEMHMRSELHESWIEERADPPRNE